MVGTVHFVTFDELRQHKQREMHQDNVKPLDGHERPLGIRICLSDVALQSGISEPCVGMEPTSLSCQTPPTASCVLHVSTHQLFKTNIETEVYR